MCNRPAAPVLVSALLLPLLLLLLAAGAPAARVPEKDPERGRGAADPCIRRLADASVPSDAAGVAQQAARAVQHTSNWAVIVATSRYWYNYRHVANALSLYRTVKRLGIPDDHIVLMLAEDAACNARNAFPGAIYNDASHALNVYGDNVEVDYRGYEVTVDNFLRVLTGRHDPAVPRAKRMLPDAGSNVLVYISGHGGNEFMKFQDTQELLAADIADALAQMHEAGRYRELLLLVETCQAATLYSRVRSPGVLSMGSSIKGESSYSHVTDGDVGLSLIDRFTWSTLDFFERVGISSNANMAQLARIYRYDVLESTFHCDASHYDRPLDTVPLTSFFGGVVTTTETPPLPKLPVPAAAADVPRPHRLGSDDTGLTEHDLHDMGGAVCTPPPVHSLQPTNEDQGGVFSGWIYAAMAGMVAVGAAASTWFADHTYLLSPLL